MFRLALIHTRLASRSVRLHDNIRHNKEEESDLRACTVRSPSLKQRQDRIYEPSTYNMHQIRTRRWSVQMLYAGRPVYIFTTLKSLQVISLGTCCLQCVLEGITYSKERNFDLLDTMTLPHRQGKKVLRADLYCFYHQRKPRLGYLLHWSLWKLRSFLVSEAGRVHPVFTQTCLIIH